MIALEFLTVESLCAIVVFPAPVDPTKAIFCPGFANNDIPFSTVFSGT
jgi:hypothetical protein